MFHCFKRSIICNKCKYKRCIFTTNSNYYRLEINSFSRHWKRPSKSKYHFRDTVSRRVLMSRSWVIYYKQLNARKAASLHQRRRAPALLLKRGKTRLLLWWIVYPFERLLSKETEAPTHDDLPSGVVLSAFVQGIPFCRCKIRFSNCRCVQHHSRCYMHFRRDGWPSITKWKDVYRRCSYRSHRCNYPPLVHMAEPSSIDFLDMIKQIVSRSGISLRKLYVSPKHTCSILLTELLKNSFWTRYKSIKVYSIFMSVRIRAHIHTCKVWIQIKFKMKLF